jgi:hypothetical protein
MLKLVVGSGVLRPCVKRFHCDLKTLTLLGSNESHLLLANFPKLTHDALDGGRGCQMLHLGAACKLPEDTCSPLVR